VLRIATTLGDLVNFAWGSAVMAKQKKMEAQPHADDLPAGLP
jgi:hypothetical protein